MPPWDPSLPGFFIELGKSEVAPTHKRSALVPFVSCFLAVSQSSTVAELLSRGPPALGCHPFVFGVTNQRFDDVLPEVNRLFPSQGQQPIELFELLEKFFRTTGQKRDQVRAAIRAIRKDALECLRAFLTGAPRPDTVPVVRHVRNLCQGD